MISLPSGAGVGLACGRTDMRKGIDGLAMLAQQVLTEDPFGGACLRSVGKGGGLVKLLWYDGQGMCLFSKRLEKGHFIWPVSETGRVSLTPAQLSFAAPTVLPDDPAALQLILHAALAEIERLSRSRRLRHRVWRPAPRRQMWSQMTREVSGRTLNKVTVCTTWNYRRRGHDISTAGSG